MTVFEPTEFKLPDTHGLVTYSPGEGTSQVAITAFEPTEFKLPDIHRLVTYSPSEGTSQVAIPVRRWGDVTPQDVLHTDVTYSPSLGFRQTRDGASVGLSFKHDYVI